MNGIRVRFFATLREQIGREQAISDDIAAKLTAAAAEFKPMWSWPVAGTREIRRLCEAVSEDEPQQSGLARNQPAFGLQ